MIPIRILCRASLLFVAACGGGGGTVAPLVVEGSGHFVSTTRGHIGFDRVTVEGFGKLVIRQGNRDTVRVTADDNVELHLQSEVRDGELLLRPHDGVRIASAHIVWIVTVQKLSAIRVAGSIEVEAHDIRGDRIRIRIDGDSEFLMSGVVTRQEIEANGTIVYDATAMQSGEVDIRGSALFDVDVHAEQRLSGGVCGLGSVRYLGEPEITLDTCALISVYPSRR